MIKKHIAITFGILLLTVGSFTSMTNSATESLNPSKLAEIDALVTRAMNTFHVPGMAVGIVIDNTIVLTKGYGVRSQGSKLPVTDNTIFAIGSCSKAFTALALAQMVDEKLIAWDDPVIKYLPEFSLKNEYTTRHLTIRDLIAHRSGLPRHDFLWYNSKLTRKEFLPRLQYLESSSDIREKFQYNNLMYLVAGLIIERVTGKTWEERVQTHIFDPLGMTSSNFSIEQSQKTADFARPHIEKDGKIEIIPFRQMANMGPAGSINSPIKDMVKWVQLQLSGGNSLIQKNTLNEMHSIQMPLPATPFDETPYIFGYGLGWVTGISKGRYLVAHKGEIDGFISSIALFPTEKIGVVVLTNSNNHEFFSTVISCAIAESIMGIQGIDPICEINQREKSNSSIDNKKNTVTKPPRPLPDYTGIFENPGYGTFVISTDKQSLIATYNDITYTLEHTPDNHFTATMKTPLYERFDCFFSDDASGKISEFHISMEPEVSPILFKKE